MTPATPRHHSLPSRIRGVLRHWDAHHRFFFAFAVALLAALPLPARDEVGPMIRAVLGWDLFAFVTLVLAWLSIVLADPYEVRRNARLQDANRTFLFVIVISAATASLLAVGLLLGQSKENPLGAASLGGHIALALAAIFLSWALIHTLFTLRYAHYYYKDARQKAREHIKGGIDFPGNEHPDYLDFAYFSFVIGMTAQVSDVTISERRVRRVVLVHGLISFLFNTAILAIFVNIVAGLL
ncbi:Uncharacterized membrane protein [Verrucomicrobium sp. GAS474]|uniref:DUF1345 domain-containing protein n=1 Tax=Verrucomicrobium sp. GAS474 TaxID=1882831 RepID=UPI00087DE936|nr:DUF1345 domain-containing protein [Verrucomicrobium sp. GAS474]SDT88935.1 Uncharacterized membrane protein [Verrucomicrobium sp. GAS474]